jgi:hypothetical protein
MKIVFLSLFVVLNLFGYSQKDLVKIYEINFKENELLKVKEIDNHYFIVSSTFLFDNKKNINKLSLLSKAILFQYLKKQDKKIQSLELQKFQTAFSWKKNQKEYLFSFIPKSLVRPIYIKSKNMQTEDIIYKEIKNLEKIKKKNIVIHEQLKSLYFQISDIKNYNIQAEKIMEMKFNDF